MLKRLKKTIKILKILKSNQGTKKNYLKHMLLLKMKNFNNGLKKLLFDNKKNKINYKNKCKKKINYNFLKLIIILKELIQVYFLKFLLIYQQHYLLN